MQINPEQRKQAAETLAQHLVAMGYRHPAADSPGYKLDASDPLSVVKSAITAYKFLNLNAPKEN